MPFICECIMRMTIYIVVECECEWPRNHVDKFAFATAFFQAGVMIVLVYLFWTSGTLLNRTNRSFKAPFVRQRFHQVRVVRPEHLESHRLSGRRCVKAIVILETCSWTFEYYAVEVSVVFELWRRFQIHDLRLSYYSIHAMSSLKKLNF